MQVDPCSEPEPEPEPEAEPEPALAPEPHEALGAVDGPGPLAGPDMLAWLSVAPMPDLLALPVPTPVPDPLSSVLRITVEPDMGVGLLLAESDVPWTARRDLPSGLGWVGAESGSCWVHDGDEATSIFLEPGDAALLRAPAAVVTSPEAPLATVAPVPLGVGVRRVDGAFLPDLTVYSGCVAMTGAGERLLPMPRSIVLRGGFEELAASLRPELLQSAPGSNAVLDALGLRVLVRLLRAHIPVLTRSADAPQGLLRALGDGGLHPALGRLHMLTEPLPSVTELADECSLPRVSFVRRFEDATGTPPIAYARRWRAAVARHLLTTTRGSVDEVAAAVGYGSARSLRRLLAAQPESPGS